MLPLRNAPNDYDQKPTLKYHSADAEEPMEGEEYELEPASFSRGLLAAVGVALVLIIVGITLVTGWFQGK